MITVFEQVSYSSKPVKAINISWTFEVCGIRRLMNICSLAGTSNGACDALRKRCDQLIETPALFRRCLSMAVRRGYE